MRRRARVLAIACAMSLVVAACGDDDDVASGGDGEPASSSDVDAYCELVEEINTQDGPPTDEQMEEIKEIRPDEIGAEVDRLADAIIEADGDVGSVFADPEIEADTMVLDEFESQNCPGGAGGGEAEGDVNPEFAEYCEASDSLGEDGPPTEEDIRELVDLAPEAIAEPAGVVADVVEANGGDVDAIFSDPEGGAAIGEIEAWEAENCGGGDDEESDGDLEAAEGAEVVPVVGVDFGYEDVPATLDAGPVAFEFTNEGEAIHEAVLFALEDGESVDGLIAEAEATFESGDDDADIGELGFAFAPPGGDARYINAELEAGEYVFICFIPGPEGKPHHELGMQQTFTVG